MNTLPKTLLVLALAAACTAASAAPKAESKKAEKPRNSRYGAPTEKSLVGLAGGETPEQIDKAYADAIAALLPTLGTDDPSSLQSLEATVHHATRPGAETERTACCTALTGAFGASTQTAARVILLQQFVNVGGAGSVAFLARTLSDPESWVRETARCALQNNPAPEAAAALRDALAKATEPAAKSAMALALAARRDAASVPAIAKLLAAPDEDAAAIACDALAAIGDDAATKALLAGLKSVPEKLRPVAATACLKVSDRFLREGRITEATTILTLLSELSPPPAVRHAVRSQELTAAGDKAAPKMLALLAGGDAADRSIALGRLAALDAAGRRTVVDGMEKLPADMQAVVLGSLAGLGEKAALPVAMKLAGSSDAALRGAGLHALGQLGDASSAGMVCAAFVRAQDKTERAQLEQLLGVFPGGAATDEALLAAMQKSAGESRLALMSVLGRRNSRAAVPVLLAETAGTDEAAARRAFQVLGTLALAGDVPVLLEKAAAVKSNAIRGDAEGAAARALTRIEDAAARSDAVLKAFGDAPPADARKSMLKLLAACGDTRALDVVQAALKDADAGIREAAVRSLASWPEPNAWDALSAIHARPEKESFGAIALRGLVKLVQTDKKLSAAQQVGRYRELLAGAKGDADRKTILGGLGRVEHPAALELVLPLLDDPAVRGEAEQAVRTIAAAVQKNAPDAAKAALDRLKN